MHVTSRAVTVTGHRLSQQQEAKLSTSLAAFQIESKSECFESKNDRETASQNNLMKINAEGVNRIAWNLSSRLLPCLEKGESGLLSH